MLLESSKWLLIFHHCFRRDWGQRVSFKSLIVCSKGAACKTWGLTKCSMEDLKTNQQPQHFSLMRKGKDSPIGMQYLGREPRLLSWAERLMNSGLPAISGACLGLRVIWLTGCNIFQAFRLQLLSQQFYAFLSLTPTVPRHKQPDFLLHCVFYPFSQN